MKRRTGPGLIILLLTGMWLCVQSPWMHAARMQAQVAMPEITVAHADCHGDESGAGVPASESAPSVADCCADGHCDGQCAHLSVLLFATTWQFIAAEPAPVPRNIIHGRQCCRQPQLFRPPIV